MERSAFGPAMDALFVGYGLHNDTEEIGGAVAFVQNARFNFFRSEAGALEQLAGEPGIQHFLAIFSISKISEARAQQIEGVAFGVVDGKTAGGKQRVIEELGAG